MNAGLGSLALLKKHLLAAPLRSGTDHDAAITLLGQGVASAMEARTNRRFYRTIGDTWQTDADASAFVLPRYPIETLTSVELRLTPADAWETQTLADVIRQRLDNSGVIILAQPLGTDRSTVRWTWTGGYWWDTTEDDTGSQPSGSTALPEALRLAWVTQCLHAWSRRDKLSLGHLKAPDADSKLADLDWVPSVLDVLRQYTRHG